MAIQAVDAEVRRFRALPDDAAVPGNEVLLIDFENVADELEDAYAGMVRTIANLSPCTQPVGRG